MIRTLTLDDVDAIARISRRARFDAIPDYPDLHTPAEDVAFFREQVAECGGLADVDVTGVVRGFVLWRGQMVEHLYVDLGHQGMGVGSALLAAALGAIAQRPVRLWTFQGNTRAVAFYRRHGFVAVEWTDGDRNEEGLPDVLFELR